MNLNALLEGYRKELKTELEMKLQASDRLVISTNKNGTALKSIKSKDLILFKNDNEQLTLADMLIEYKVLVKIILDLIKKQDKITEQFLKLLELYKLTNENVELIKQEVL